MPNVKLDIPGINEVQQLHEAMALHNLASHRVKKVDDMFKDRKIADYFDLIPEGKEIVGIEVEAEFDDHLTNSGMVGGFWRLEYDGSLRGFNPLEFVSRGSVGLHNWEQAVEALEDVISTNPFNYSYRAGIHVHVDVRNLTIAQLENFVTLYYMLEPQLLAFCGENRSGNLFCLGVSEAEYQKTRFIKAMIKEDLDYVCTDDIRYSALNFTSLEKYGSLEFRAMDTREGLQGLKEWVKMLHAIRDYAISSEPRLLLEQFSMMGPYKFTETVLGELSSCLPKIDEKEMRQGMRNAQDVVYKVEL